MSRENKRLYEFGPFRLDTGERVLWRGKQVVPLTPKAYETLLALIRNSGHIMEKEELLKEVWAGTFVEEATLAQNIFTLRRALGNGQNDGQKYIETIPRRGYRFVADVREVADDATQTRAARVGDATDEANVNGTSDEAAVAADESDGAEVATSEVAASEVAVREVSSNAGVAAAGEDSPQARGMETGVVYASRPWRGAVLIAAAFLFVLACATFGIYRLSVRRETAATLQPPRASFQSMKVARLAINGTPQEAVISPDGKYVAYVADEGGQRSIWVKQAATTSGNAQQIVAPTGARYAGLVFSRDSEYLYYVAWAASDAPAQLFQMPVFGGASRPLAADLNSPVTFAPDGRRFAFARIDFDRRENSIVVASTDADGERQLTTRKVPEVFGMPAWSPDGGVIVCAVNNIEAEGTTGVSLVEVDASSGAVRTLSPARWHEVGQLAWMPDGSGLVLSASEQELSPTQVWRLSYPSGETRRITNDLNSYFGASLTADASTLVTMQTDRVANLWVAPAADASRATQITRGPGKHDGYYGVSWTPDGRIVYASIASGAWDIWIMNADGSNQKQLTVNARSNYGPAVSSDGRYIVFVSNRTGGAFNIWRMNIDGSDPRQLTNGKGENFAHVTPDNRWVVYASTGFTQPGRVWKMPIDGGEPIALTRVGSSWPVVSPDGKFVACTFETAPNVAAKLAIVSIDGGATLKTFDLPASARANTLWSADGRAITYLDDRDGTVNIWSQPLDGSPPKQLTHFKTDSVGAYGWSFDGKQLVCSRSVETTGIVLIRDFN